MPRTISKKGAAGGGSIRKKTVLRHGKEYTYWEGRISTGFDPKTGKQLQRSISGKTQKEVAQKMREISVELDQGVYLEPSKETLGEWLDEWTKEYLIDVKPRTKESYLMQIRNHIRPELGRRRLDELTRMDIQKFYNSLTRDKHLAPKSVKVVHGILHKCLQQAVENGRLRFNPADKPKLPRIERREISVLDDEEIKSFIKAAQESLYGPVLIFTLFTGLRKGEVLGLTWDRVNLEKGTALINRQLSYCKDEENHWTYHLASTKNGKGRTIALPAFLIELLRKLKAQQEEWKSLAGEAWGSVQGIPDAELVFTNELGGHLVHQTVYRNYKRLAESIGSTDTRFHDLRHSYAVTSIRNGDDIKTVQSNLGHATAAFTLDVYGHMVDQMRRDSADRMDAYFETLTA